MNTDTRLSLLADLATALKDNHKTPICHIVLAVIDSDGEDVCYLYAETVLDWLCIGAHPFDTLSLSLSDVPLVRWGEYLDTEDMLDIAENYDGSDAGPGDSPYAEMEYDIDLTAAVALRYERGRG